MAGLRVEETAARCERRMRLRDRRDTPRDMEAPMVRSDLNRI